MNVLILDDETERANAWRGSLQEFGIEATVPNIKGVADLIQKLQEHRLHARTGTFHDFHLFDEVDLLIVDYDLLGLHGHGWTTGAEIAYAARLLSRVGPIVVVNQHGTNAFDLTMRRAAFSHADLDVGSQQIVNKGLFTSSDFKGYRPWFWPNLTTEPARLEEFSRFACENLNASVASTLGFKIDDPSSPRFLTREVCSPIALDSDVTFRQIATASRSGGLSSILEKDQMVLDVLPDDLIGRIAASVLSRWIDRFVLPNQDVLIDFPHAVVAAPWLMKGHQELEAWNDFGLRSQAPSAVDLERCKVPLKFVSSRDVYWREDIDAIDRPDGFAMSSVPDFVFCEDISRFNEVKNAKEFSANLESYLSGRWVRADDSTVLFEPQAYLLE